MSWMMIAGLGACGGALVSVLAFSADVLEWRQARRVARAKRRRLPPLGRFVDPSADLAALLTRVFLGALAGGVFHSQVSGVQAAIAVGAAAPALLSQLGSLRSAEAKGTETETESLVAASIQVPEIAARPSEEG